jgi:hypothetical protein
LRAYFSDTIQLTRLDESLPDIINTDASGKAVAAVVMQMNRGSWTCIVSTALRMLNVIQRRYSVAE